MEEAPDPALLTEAKQLLAQLAYLCYKNSRIWTEDIISGQERNICLNPHQVLKYTTYGLHLT